MEQLTTYLLKTLKTKTVHTAVNRSARLYQSSWEVKVLQLVSSGEEEQKHLHKLDGVNRREIS